MHHNHRRKDDTNAFTKRGFAVRSSFDPKTNLHFFETANGTKVFLKQIGEIGTYKTTFGLPSDNGIVLKIYNASVKGGKHEITPAMAARLTRNQIASSDFFEQHKEELRALNIKVSLILNKKTIDTDGFIVQERIHPQEGVDIESIVKKFSKIASIQDLNEFSELEKLILKGVRDFITFSAIYGHPVDLSKTDNVMFDGALALIDHFEEDSDGDGDGDWALQLKRGATCFAGGDHRTNIHAYRYLISGVKEALDVNPLNPSLNEAWAILNPNQGDQHFPSFQTPTVVVSVANHTSLSQQTTSFPSSPLLSSPSSTVSSGASPQTPLANITLQSQTTATT